MIPRRRRAMLSSFLRSAFGSKSLSSDITLPSSSSPSAVYFLGGTARSLLLSMLLLGVLKKVLTSTGYSSPSDSSVSSSSSDSENERRLRELVVGGVGRPMPALPFLTGVAEIDAPGALPLTPLAAVPVRPDAAAPVFAILRMLAKRSLTARAVGLVGPSPISRQRDCSVGEGILARTYSTPRRLFRSQF